MSNEEIRQQVLMHQMEIQKCLEQCCGRFELNPEITEHKKAIDNLRQQCSHVNDNNEIQAFNHHCAYCGKKVE